LYPLSSGAVPSASVLSNAPLPLVWYDFADTSTVTLDETGRVTRVANKGTKANMDAVVPDGYQPPLYVTDTVSFGVNDAPSIRLDGAAQGLASENNTGISGTAGRTLIAVMRCNAAWPTPASVCVFMGEDTASHAFAISDQPESSLFWLKGSTFTYAHAEPPERFIIYTFLNLSTPTSFRAYRNGVSLGDNSNTGASLANSPLLVGFRAGAVDADTPRGDIAEVVLFNSILTTVQHTAIINYLQSKWRTLPTAPLTLGNAGAGGAVLTVNASLANKTSALTKTGAGPVRLVNAAHAGTLSIAQGGVIFDQTQDGVLSGIVSGPGSLVKDGAGLLTLSGANTHGGETIVSNGTLRVNHNTALGAAAAGTRVTGGAALDVGAPTLAADALNLGAEPVTLEAGAAITNSSTKAQNSALHFVTLAGDAAFGGAAFSVVNTGAVALNGHTLTVSANSGASSFKGVPVDFGADGPEPADFPVYAEAVCRAILAGQVESGILICGTGIGMSMAANKIRGIRCAACSEPYTARLTKQHNNANVLAFGSRVVGVEVAKMMVDEWMNAVFEARHQRRLDLLEALERRESGREV
jgi:ribose 5-phosphate isomerase B